MQLHDFTWLHALLIPGGATLREGSVGQGPAPGYTMLLADADWLLRMLSGYPSIVGAIAPGGILAVGIELGDP